MLALLEPYQAFGQQKLMVEIGSSDGQLEGDRAVVRVQAGIAGGFDRSGCRWSGPRRTLPSSNAGGVRDSLAAGKLTYKDVLKVQPFGNTLSTVDLSAAEVMAYLNAAAEMSAGSGAFAQFAGSGLEIVGNQVSDVRIKGAPLDASRTYRMVINNFHGDGRRWLSPSCRTTKAMSTPAMWTPTCCAPTSAAHSPLKAADYQPGDAVVRR